MWGQPEFEVTLKQEMAHLEAKDFPLQQGLSQASVALDDGLKFIVLKTSEQAGQLTIKTGIFYKGVIGGCSCADDPTPIDEITEYCEVLLVIKKDSGEVEITLIDERD